MKIIITGATGFLGKNLTQKILEEQIEVYAIVRNKERIEKTLLMSPLLHVIELDMSEILKLPRLLQEREFEAFFHFAWEGTSGSAREDYSLQTKNILAACNAVHVAKELNCQKFINAGSLMEYESKKLMEFEAIQPVGNYIYRSSKLAAHYIAKSEAGRIGLPFINLIISNVYGIGELSGRFISSTLQKLAKGESVSFTAGTQLYDFIYLTDATEAFFHAGLHGKAYTDYYIGSGLVQPLRNYITELYSALNLTEKPQFGTVPYDGISLTYQEFDMSALKRDTGFQCSTGFTEGIQKTYQWIQNLQNERLQYEEI